MKLGLTELIIILVVVLILFGGTLIPKLFKRGKNTIKVFKEEAQKAEQELKEEEEAAKLEEAKETIPIEQMEGDVVDVESKTA